MSDTPRTDKVNEMSAAITYIHYKNMLGHALQLERELNEWKKVAGELANFTHAYFNEPTKFRANKEWELAKNALAHYTTLKAKE
jgi:hypothetical protein